MEVLSDSTEAFDRGDKLRAYRSIESLQTYLLVAQDMPTVEIYNRDGDGTWRYFDISGLSATLSLPSIACELRLADIYEGVEFAAD